MSEISAKEEILGRLRSALADKPVPAPIPRAYATAADEGTDIVALFAERAGEYRAVVERVPATELPAAVAAALRAAGVRRLVAPAGVPPEWLADAEVEVIADAESDGGESDGAGSDGGESDGAESDGAESDGVGALSVRALDGIDGVLTGAALAIAETGTVILDAGPDQGRRALSLLVDFHLCVIGVDQIVGSVPEAIARVPATRAQTWISGPSATSDIELNRVEGVHGPRRLHLILVGD